MSLFFDPRFKNLAPYTPGEQPQGRAFIKLNTNESPFPPSPLVVQAVQAEAPKLNLYSDPTCMGVIAPLAKHLNLAPEQVMVSNGSDELLAFCFQTLCPHGAAFADLTYGFYPVYCDLYGVEATIIPLREDFSLAVQDYAGLGRTIFIANPNAPTGLALAPAQIEQILRANPGNLVVVDEAYVDFGAESVVPLLDAYNNLLVVGTFSKSRSLAGARLGYAAGSSEMISDLNRVKFSFNPYNVNRMTLAAGAAALADTGYFEACRAQIMATREQFSCAVQQMGYLCTNSMANFVFVRHPEKSGERLYHTLRERGFLVRWFANPRISEYLRITVGTSEQMNLLLQELSEILPKHIF